MKNQRSRINYITPLALLIVLLSFSCQSGKNEDKQGNQGTDLPNDFPQKTTFSSLELKNLEGQSIKLDSNRLSFINLWATWCMPCIKEMPSLKRLEMQLNKDMDFYFASYESTERVLNFDKKTPIDLSFYTYDDSAIPSELETAALPYTVIVKGEKVLYTRLGATEWLHPNVYDTIESIVNRNK